MKKRISPMKGKKHSEQTKNKISKSLIGRNAWNKGLKGVMPIPSWKNKNKYNNEICKKISLINSKKRGSETSNWRGGISYRPYPIGWTKTFREQVRYGYKYKCQLCGCHEVDCNRRLHVHHIDYDKNNLKEENLIPLCCSCHMKTNYNRTQWKEYFLNKRGDNK